MIQSSSKSHLLKLSIGFSKEKKKLLEKKWRYRHQAIVPKKTYHSIQEVTKEIEAFNQ